MPPLERFETIALTGFGVAALLQAVLGTFRSDGSPAGPLLVAVGILACGGLWLLRVRRMAGGGLAVPVGLLLPTIGVYAAYTASNVPFVSFLGRYSVPALLICTGALLLFAEQEWDFQIFTFALAGIAFVIAQAVLTLESRVAAQPLPVQRQTAGGVIGELQLVALAQAYVDDVNAREATANITVSRWIVEDNTVVGFGTTSGHPSVVRAEFRSGKVVEWWVYIENGGSK